MKMPYMYFIELHSETFVFHPYTCDFFNFMHVEHVEQKKNVGDMDKT